MWRLSWVLLGILGIASRASAKTTLFDATVISAEVSVDARTTADGHGKTVRVPISLSEPTPVSLLDGAVSLSVNLEEAGDAVIVPLSLEAEVLRPVYLHSLSVALTVDMGSEAGAEIIGRDLKPVTLRADHRARLDRFDPKWVTLTRKEGHDRKQVATLSLDDTIDGLSVRAHGHTIEIVIELESAEARPFFHDAHCTSNWRDVNKHLPVQTRLFTAKEQFSAHGQWIKGARTPIVKAHFPDARRAALVITDHADQSSAHTFLALVDVLIEHHLSITKSLFAHGSDRPQLEDPTVVALADRLAKAGSEIVPHSATPKRDERAVTEAALDRFERWHARTWIDHQPETNCEAFGDEGYRVGGRFGIADLLSAHNYRYIWAEVDAPSSEFNLLRPTRLDERAPTFWPLGRLAANGPEGLWMFRSVWSFLEAKRFFSMYRPDALDRLEKERGLHIAHTYLETYHPHRTLFGRRNLFLPADRSQHPGGPGKVVPDPRFTSLLSALEERVRRGTLWMPTVSELGDWLAATSEVTLRFSEDRGAVIIHAPRALERVTFVVPANVSVTIGTKTVPVIASAPGETTFVRDLKRGDTTVTITPQ